MIKFRGIEFCGVEYVEGYLLNDGDCLRIFQFGKTPLTPTGFYSGTAINPSTLQVMTTDGWADIADVEVVRKKSDVSGSLPIEEVALHAADDWFDTAKLRSDVRADLKSYYEGYRDAMRFCQGNGC